MLRGYATKAMAMDEFLFATAARAPDVLLSRRSPCRCLIDSDFNPHRPIHVADSPTFSRFSRGFRSFFTAHGRIGQACGVMRTVGLRENRVRPVSAPSIIPVRGGNAYVMPTPSRHPSRSRSGL